MWRNRSIFPARMMFLAPFFECWQFPVPLWQGRSQLGGGYRSLLCNEAPSPWRNCNTWGLLLMKKIPCKEAPSQCQGACLWHRTKRKNEGKFLQEETSLYQMSFKAYYWMFMNRFYKARAHQSSKPEERLYWEKRHSEHLFLRKKLSQKELGGGGGIKALGCLSSFSRCLRQLNTIILFVVIIKERNMLVWARVVVVGGLES